MIGPWLASVALAGMSSVIHFEPAGASPDGRTRYVARGPGHTAFFDREGATLALFRSARDRDGRAAPPVVIRISLVGARRADPAGRELLPSTSNYLKGRDPRAWRTGVPHYARIEFDEAYPGVDLSVHGREPWIESDFIVAPRADPRRIRLRFDGARRVRLEKDGRLVLDTDAGPLALRPPVAYQEGPLGRETVPSSYRLAARRGEVSFALGAYDRGRPLVIDPVLDYSSYLGGGGGDGARGLAVDARGYRYLTGATLSADFPTVNPAQPALAGGYDVFVAKLDPQGSALVYSTYLGGSGMDQGRAIAVDAAGSAHVVGLTDSTDFPLVGPVQSALAGAADAFVAALSPSGNALAYSTYLGGAFHDSAEAVGLTASAVVVAGWTVSQDFPTLNPLQPAAAGGISDAFVTSLDRGGSALLYSTYLGGGNADRAHGLAVDAEGETYVAGVTLSADFPILQPVQAALAGDYDGFVAKIDGSGTKLRYATFLGGSRGEALTSVAVDASRAVYVAGRTWSDDFPTRRGYQHGKAGPTTTSDGFVAKLDPSGSTLAYSTYVGGAGNDAINALAVDSRGSAHVTGETHSSDFPLVHEIMGPPGLSDVFITKFDADGRRLVFSTCFGGRLGADAGEAIAVGRDGAVHVAGRTEAPDLALKDPLQAQYAGQGDGFVARIRPDAVTWELSVDATSGPTSNGNGVFDMGETVEVAPVWRNDGPAPLTTLGVASSFLGPGGIYVTYTVADASADYGTLPAGGAGGCEAAGDCYRLGIAAIELRRRFHWDATFRELLAASGNFVKWTVHVGETFADIPRTNPYSASIETLVHLGVTGGCVAHGEIYCPSAPVTREEMAVFVAGARDRPGLVLPACGTGPRLFKDVPATSPFCPWIESLARRGVVGGCGGGSYCPALAVTREQMPVFVLAALEGSRYRPPACARPPFEDVPPGSAYCSWIAELARRGVVAGCGNGKYCPQQAVNRGQMAAFITAGFGLRLYGP